MVPSTPANDALERIEDIDVSTEMRDSFLEYAYSVIYSRALPDARDGLKPVQRRILFMMSEMGLRPDKGHVKSASVVGEVMGKLHPHGDASIYDALVRLAQDFSLRLPLIDGHGNFGSLDDGPAAARYAEARLAGERRPGAAQKPGETACRCAAARDNGACKIEQTSARAAAAPERAGARAAARRAAASFSAFFLASSARFFASALAVAVMLVWVFLWSASTLALVSMLLFTPASLVSVHVFLMASKFLEAF